MKLPSLQTILLLFILSFPLVGILFWIRNLDIVQFGLNHELQDLEKIRNSRVSLSYEITKDHWTDFPIPQKSDLIRIMTHADLSPDYRNEADIQFTYSIDYECIDSSQAVLKKGTYHHRVQFNWKVDPNTGERIRKSYYLDNDQIPSTQSTMFLNFHEMDHSITRIRLKLNDIDPAISAVLSRCYYWQKFDRLQPINQWHRLSRYQKEKLAQGNIYEYSFLTDEEKINLMQSSWRPFGPRGIEGKDYFLRKLYVLKEFEGIPEEILKEESGIQTTEAGRPYIFEIPQDLPSLRIYAKAHNESLSSDNSIQVIFHDSISGEKHIENWSPSKHPYYQKKWPPGLLELRSLHPFDLSFEIQTEQEWSDYYPNHPTIRGFYAKPERPLEYKITHIDNSITPFRCSFRIPMNEAGLIPKTSVRFELIDSDNTVISTINKELHGSYSEYDFIQSVEGFQSISESISCFFRLSPSVDKIRITPEIPLLLVGFNRIYQSPRIVSMPKDDNPIYDREKLPVWFMLKPYNWHYLQFKNESAILHYRESPDIEPDMLIDGNYEIEVLSEQLNHDVGRYFYYPYSYRGIYKKEILAYFFMKYQSEKNILST